MKYRNPVTVEKKTHCVKNDVLSISDRRIVWLSKTYDGSTHDKKICDEHPLHLPHSTNLWQDTGFLGHLPKNVNVIMPVKKPKGKELTAEQRNIFFQSHRRTRYRRCKTMSDSERQV